MRVAMTRMVKTKTAKMDPTETFVTNIRDCQGMLEVINEFVTDDHMGKSPDNIDWMDVGDSGRMKEMLAEICEAFNLKINH